MSTHHFLLTGLPESGKTSYLAAFWIYANGAPQSAFSVKSYPPQADYLDLLQTHWLEFRKVPRTSAGADRSVTLSLTRKSDRQDIELTIPDLAGESFRDIWSHRHWSRQFQDLLDSASGALLFIHPQMLDDGTTIQLVRELQSELPAVPAAQPAALLDPAPFDPTKVPTQIQLIDILQLMQQHGQMPTPFRLGLVISAWDSVIALTANADPATWLRQHMPALYQFLESNPESFEFAIFGVSAQGYDYDKLSAAQLEMHPHHRCRVAGAHAPNANDISAPLIWLAR